jgi:hypothetical protein
MPTLETTLERSLKEVGMNPSIFGEDFEQTIGLSY